MLITTGHQKVQTDTMKAYRKHSRNQRQYNYHQCQLGHMTSGNALLISMCILMLPLVQLSAEHVQLATMRHVNLTNQWCVHRHHMNVSHTPLVLPSLGNVLPAKVLQSSLVRLNISCPSYTSSHFSVCHIPPSLHLDLLSGLLGRRMVGVVLVLLLLLSGDIETNPGPVGQGDLKCLHSELHSIADKWFSLGVQLQVPIETLKCIRWENLPMTERLLEMLTVWLKCSTPPPTWNILTEALESPPVGERLLAQKLRDKFGQRTEEIITHDNPSEGLSSVCFSTPQGSYWQYPQGAFPYSMPQPPHHYHAPPLSAPYYSSPPTSCPMSTQLLPPPLSGATHNVPPTTVFSQVTPGPTLVTSSYLPTPMIISSPYPVPPPHPLSLISDSTPPDTPPTPQTPTVNPPPEHTGLPGVEFHKFLLNTPILERIRIMEDKFDQLVDKAQDGLVEQNIPLQRLKRCITRLPASIKYQHIAFVEEKLKDITNSECMEEIFGVVNLYWDFLNYTLLEHIIDKFGNNDTKTAMAKFVSELVAFRKATKLSDFITHWPCTGKIPPDMSKLVTKIEKEMEKDWSNCTLEDVEQFRTTLTQKLLLPSFAVFLRDAEQGCISLTWAIPSSIVKLLSKDIHNTKLEWFKEHQIERLAIDGQDLYSSTRVRYSTFLRKLYTSQKIFPTLSSSPLPQKLLPFKLARITKEKVSTDEFTKRYLRGDMDDVGSFGTEFYKKSPFKFEDVGKLLNHHQQKLILIEGAPGVGKTTFSWEFCTKWSRGEILQDHSLLLLLPLRDNNLKEAKTLSDLFCHPNSELQQAVVQEVTSNKGKGVAIWLEAWDELDHGREKASVFLDLIYGRILSFATIFITSRPKASEHLRKNCGHRIFQHVEILTSAKDQIEHYTSKTGLSHNPAIRAAMYTPITAKMTDEVFTWRQQTESPLPTTMTELFTAFTLKTLVDHLSAHPVYHKQQLKITTFSDLPADVYKQFQDLCKMAYEGILNWQQLVFSKAHLPTGFAPLGLMQEVPQLYTEGRASSYHFIHLTLQEYLAAIHISQLPDQTSLVQEYLDNDCLKNTIRFLAGLRKLVNVSTDIAKLSDNTKLNYFHLLFEAKVNTRTQGSYEMYVSPHYSWTSLDYYVTGHAISHSNCPWKLNFEYTSIDDEKFELFCQACAATEGTRCKGNISFANFSGNDITSKSIQSFVNVSPHILQDMRVVWLNHNQLDGSACDLLAKAVPSMSRLEVLWLGDNPIGSGGAVAMIKALCGSGVEELLLYNTGIEEPDCEALCELLKSSHSLQHLDIYGNNLTSESVASVITGFSHNSSLTYLDISNSYFSMTNVVSIASVLREQSKCTLTVLWLQDCHIGGQSASELAAALCNNSILKYLSLKYNPIGVDGASSMSDMLQHNTSLDHLNLCDDSVGKKGVHQLINSLKHNQTLKQLYLPVMYKSETTNHRIQWL